ncbi:MAG: NnrU family protein [Gemmobacter sp.]
MSYLVLIAGVALWSAAHLFKRVAPDLRAGMGEAGKGLVALALLVSLALMVLGYRGTDPAILWSPPAFLRHVNNLLMLVSVWLFIASVMKLGVTRRVRHPQLTAVKTWALAHLLVRGDLASLILFGGLLAWAVAEVIVINRATPRPAPPPPAGAAKEAAGAGVALVAYAAIGWVHGWLGYWPFG